MNITDQGATNTSTRNKIKEADHNTMAFTIGALAARDCQKIPNFPSRDSESTTCARKRDKSHDAMRRQTPGDLRSHSATKATAICRKARTQARKEKKRLIGLAAKETSSFISSSQDFCKISRLTVTMVGSRTCGCLGKRTEVHSSGDWKEDGSRHPSDP